MMASTSACYDIVDDLPDLKIEINGQKVTISPSGYVLDKMPFGAITVDENEDYNFSNTYRCWFGLDVQDGGTVRLGGVFLRNYAVNLDYSGNGSWSISVGNDAAANVGLNGSMSSSSTTGANILTAAVAAIFASVPLFFM